MPLRVRLPHVVILLGLAALFATVAPLGGDSSGVGITGVVPGFTAAGLGLRPGDRVLEMDGAPGRETTVFRDVNVVPMDRERVLPHRSVVVRGDRIVTILPADA
ncbi:MAG TPA: PDZ domain-containing protein, partial [Gemmatimonadales bacterium]